MINETNLTTFLQVIDKSFPIPLSDKCDLNYLAKKLISKGTICYTNSNDKITGIVAGYTDNLVDGKAYISIVGVVEEEKRKGIASKLISDFITICKDKKISSIHLYTHKNNVAALRLYEKMGFVKYIVSDEVRKDDIHLIIDIC